LKNRLLTVGIILSLTIFLGLVGLNLYAEFRSPNKDVDGWSISCPHISFAKVNVTISKYWGGCIVVYNREFPNFNLGGGQTTTTQGDWLLFNSKLIKAPELDPSWWTAWFRFRYPLIIFGALTSLLMLKRLRANQNNVRQ
jgi:hypothetical protein